jgi:lysozyme family protein
MSAFDEAFEYTMKEETSGRKDGGYTNDPDDPGGETKWGFSKRYNPDLDIKNLTKERAKQLAFERYWKKYKCDKIDPAAIAIKYFDTIFSMGETGVWLLQEAIRRVETPPGVVQVDGKIGPLTLGAVNQIAKEGRTFELMVRYCESIRNYRDRHSKFKYRSGHIMRALRAPKVDQ